MTQNPNWPLIEYAIAWAGTPTQTSIQPLWSEVTQLTQGKTTVKRGKQYELDQCQPGSMTFTLRNDTGSFDPANASSIYAGKVIPYRLVRLRAQYPATINLLTADQATAEFSSQGLLTSTLYPQWTSAVVGSGTCVLTIANNGTSNYFTMACSASNIGAGMECVGWSAAPGVTYSGQVMVNASTGVTVRLNLVWYDINNAIISTTSGSTATPGATNTKITVTSTAPSNACSGNLYLSTTAAPASAYTINCVSWQLEKNNAASAYVQPNPWYYLFTGFIERWPQEWTSNGNKGLSNLTCIDLFTFFANKGMIDPFDADLLALSPDFCYRLNESEGATSFIDFTGNRPAMTISSSASWITPGGSIESADNAPQGGDGSELTGSFLGGVGPVVNQAAKLFPSLGGAISGGVLVVPPSPTTGYYGPPSGDWTRMIAGCMTVGGTNPGMLWDYSSGPGGQLGDVQIGIPYSGGAYLPVVYGTFAGNTGGGGTIAMPNLSSQITAGTVTDGDWHLYAISYASSTGILTVSVDGRYTTSYIGTGIVASSPGMTSPAGGADLIGFATGYENSITAYEPYAFEGSIAYATQWSYALLPAQFPALYKSWRNSWAYSIDNTTETSDQRYIRILNWLGYGGPYRIQSGYSLQYGPAIDITGGDSPTDGLTALQNVVDTELGQHFIGPDGAVVFQSRGNRYNRTSTVTFGEHQSSGEVPYLDLKTDFDPTRVANTVTVTSEFTNLEYYASDATSIYDYGNVTLSATVNSLSTTELQTQAQFLVLTNKQPLQRLEELPIDVAANSTVAWAATLPLDLSSCVTVNRRPSNAPLITVTGFVEQITWDLADNNTAKCTLQVSNSADMSAFGVFDSATLGLFDSTLVFAY